MPANYLENFNSIKKNIKKISKKIKIIVTGNCHYFSDHFNILSAEILNNKSGKLIIFQHGGSVSKTNRLEIEYKDQKYAARRYYFDNRKGLGMHFFNKKKITFEELKKRDSILILSCEVYFEEDFFHNPLNYKNYYVSSLVFFSKLNQLNKKKVLVKLFPHKNSLKVKNLWEKKFEGKIYFLPFMSNAKKKRYYNAKLVILDEISTPIWEVLFFGLPFILICNNSFLASWQYNNLFKKKFNRLKKINILFNDPAQAAQFVNSLDKDYLIEEWWKKISKTKIFLDFKNFLIVEKLNYLPRIIKELQDLNK